MEFNSQLPAWIEAISTLVGATFTIVAILIAVRQVRLTGRQLRESAEQEARNSEERTRPYVGVDVVTGLAGSSSFDIVFENFGRSTAKGVVVSLVGDTFRAQSDQDEIGPALGRLFAVPFDLAPSARRRVFWRMPEDAMASPRGAIGTPISGEVQVSFLWDGPIRRRYTETVRYDLTEYPKLIPMASRGATSGSADEGKNATLALRAIAESLGELRR